MRERSGTARAACPNITVGDGPYGAISMCAVFYLMAIARGEIRAGEKRKCALNNMRDGYEPSLTIPLYIKHIYQKHRGEAVIGDDGDEVVHGRDQRP